MPHKAPKVGAAEPTRSVQIGGTKQAVNNPRTPSAGRLPFVLAVWQQCANPFDSRLGRPSPARFRCAREAMGAVMRGDDKPQGALGVPVFWVCSVLSSPGSVRFLGFCFLLFWFFCLV